MTPFFFFFFNVKDCFEMLKSKESFFFPLKFLVVRIRKVLRLAHLGKRNMAGVAVLCTGGKVASIINGNKLYNKWEINSLLPRTQLSTFLRTSKIFLI